MPRREAAAATQVLPARTIDGGMAVDAPLAEHGFSMLVTAVSGGQSRRPLFDTGLTPTGCVDNLRRLDQDPGDIEAIVCSHGHFDHTAFWARRRLAIPGGERCTRWRRVSPAPSSRTRSGLPTCSDREHPGCSADQDVHRHHARARLSAGFFEVVEHRLQSLPDRSRFHRRKPALGHVQHHPTVHRGIGGRLSGQQPSPARAKKRLRNRSNSAVTAASVSGLRRSSSVRPGPNVRSLWQA